MKDTNSKKNYSLTLSWLYPELMSTYGDRGNIIVLEKIADENGIELVIKRVNQTTNPGVLKESDLVFMGGAQDLQQEIVNKDLLGKKGEILKQLIEANIPGLFICGAFQFLGKHYKDAYGTIIKGLGVFDMTTETPTNRPRLTGTIVIQANKLSLSHNYLVGFENHGGRTNLANKELSFGKVVVGNGNNGGDQTEGIHYRNSFGTYMHGPILPSNPELAIHLLKSALRVKYKKEIAISFDTTLSDKAKMVVLSRLKLSY